jgi:hypothetical protein
VKILLKNTVTSTNMFHLHCPLAKRVEGPKLNFIIIICNKVDLNLQTQNVVLLRKPQNDQVKNVICAYFVT